MSKISLKNTIYTSAKVVYGLALVATPVWGSGALLATFMMNDSDSYKDRFQNGCLVSLLATPFCLASSVIGIHKGYKLPFFIYLPLIPISTYVICCTAFFNDKKNK
ncbi:hypothetical protein ACTFIZ_011247 [Dictyostelium cf. discoideum]